MALFFGITLSTAAEVHSIDIIRTPNFCLIGRKVKVANSIKKDDIHLKTKQFIFIEGIGMYIHLLVIEGRAKAFEN